MFGESTNCHEIDISGEKVDSDVHWGRQRGGRRSSQNQIQRPRSGTLQRRSVGLSTGPLASCTQGNQTKVHAALLRIAPVHGGLRLALRELFESTFF